MTFKLNYNRSTDSGGLTVCTEGHTTTLDISVLKVRISERLPELINEFRSFGLTDWNALLNSLTETQIKQLL